MVRITIDGLDFEVPKGTTVLEAARRNGFEIPTLCYHEALEPIGSCRLCLVELGGGEKGEVVSSCTHPVEKDGLVVYTESPAVLQARKMNLSLLLARCPGVKCLQDLAYSWWVDSTALPVLGDYEKECILCGRCVRVCREAIGKEAISFTFRGVDRQVLPPFKQQPDDCIGCTACAYVCPTGAVKVTEEEGRRFIAPWKSDLPLYFCDSCEAPVTTIENSASLEEKIQETGLPPGSMRPSFKTGEREPEGTGSDPEINADEEMLCPRCRRRRVTESVARLPREKQDRSWIKARQGYK